MPGAGLQLKRNHAYFSQLQMELAMTGCLWADFVVYIQYGESDEVSVFVEQVQFDSAVWSQYACSLEAFYKKFVVLEILTRRLKLHLWLLPK